MTAGRHLKLGSLCAGIGGFDLGLERAGLTVSWQVEIDPFCRRVLAKHWPNGPRYEDLTTLDGTELEPVDLICAGFPCQPVSVAGARRAQDDRRWLWPHIARLVGVLRPRYVVLENTPGLFTAGDPPGSAFAEVVGDLASLGYDCEWDVISAADVGAPHLRKRVWIVAESQRARFGVQSRHTETRGQRGEHSRASQPTLVSPDDGETRPEGIDTGRTDLAHADSARRPRNQNDDGARVRQSDAPGGRRGDQRERQKATRKEALADANHEVQPSRTFYADEGASLSEFTSGHQWWSIEPNVGRVAHGVPKRVDRLRGLGNAVVPQVVEWIGHRIMDVERDRIRKNTKGG